MRGSILRTSVAKNILMMFVYKRPEASTSAVVSITRTLANRSHLSITMTTSMLAAPLDPTVRSQGEQAEDINLHKNPYAVNLEKTLMEKNELMIDFSSLKTCLDPQCEPAETTDETEVSQATHFQLHCDLMRFMIIWLCIKW